jgi:hypothetical protein
MSGMAATSGWSTFLGRHSKILKDRGVDGWNEWRRENPKVEPILIGAKLAQKNLEGVNLSDAILRGAGLNHANLKGANLDRADLYNASLLNVVMADASLRGAVLNQATVNGDLRRVTLTGARLRGTQIYGSILAGANFRGAFCGATVFAASDLSACKNLSAVRHVGPSTIGIDTIYYSRGKIPTVFLKRAGAPAEFIAEIPSMMAAVGPARFYSCFISYSHGDSDVAKRINESLEARGIRCWRDEEQMRSGDRIREAIRRGIDRWDKVLVLCSRKSMTSGWVDAEIRLGLGKEERLTNERGKDVQAVIPIDLDGYILSDECTNEYREVIRDRLASDFTGCTTNATKFSKQLEKLVLALRADDAARRKPPVPKL